MGKLALFSGAGRSRPVVHRCMAALLVALLFLLAGCGLRASAQLAPSYQHPGPGAGSHDQAPAGIRPAYALSFTFGLKRPLAVAPSPDGAVYVADGECRCIRVFDARGGLTSTIGPEVGGMVLSYPAGLAYDAVDGTLYVSDLGAGRLLRLRGEENLGTFPAGSTAEEVRAPVGVLVVGDLIYVNDVGRHAILVFNRAGTLVRTVGKGQGTELGSLAYPNYSQVLADGSILVADSNNNRLQHFSVSGEPEKIWAGPLMLPRGMVLDPAGNIHVASTLNGRIEVFGPAGRYLGGYGGEGSGPDQLAFPTGLARQGDRLYIADRMNGRVQVWTWSGEVPLG